MNDASINFRVPVQLSEQLRREAEKRGVSVGALVRHFLYIQFEHKYSDQGR